MSRRFDWDPLKARANIAKHGIDFNLAIEAHNDPNNLVEYDDGPHDDERWRLTGLSSKQLLFVVFAEPDDDVVRIISAREANKHEQDRYFRQARPKG